MSNDLEISKNLLIEHVELLNQYNQLLTINNSLDYKSINDEMLYENNNSLEYYKNVLDYININEGTHDFVINEDSILSIKDLLISNNKLVKENIKVLEQENIYLLVNSIFLNL